MLLYNKLKDSKDFTSAEKAIVDYILNNPKEAINLSVDELANVTFSSPSCVVRLAKKLGMKGYSEFKIKLATEMNMLLIDEKRIEVNMPVCKDTKLEDIPKRFYNLYYQIITDVYNSFDINKMIELADRIYKSDSVTMFGVGPSMLVIQDFIYKASHLRLPIFANSLIGFENVHNFRNAKNPLTIVVSNNANSNRVRNWIFENKKLNIPVALITANEHSPLIKVCDHVVIMDHGEHDITKIGSFASRIAMLYALDILYILLFMKDYETNLNYLYDYQNLIKERDVRLREYINNKKYL
ncbi:MAG: MurR/RpiR family transcriptional regulator [Erysipelotrichaceae bacterium]|nr:MurR/RpiR family transcriptional regulator [Erysipelotrichaceae bacterium]MDY5252949.1 MurR/RpiR family transcriptional regulator [Erysipelotrichaceae bacterium]